MFAKPKRLELQVSFVQQISFQDQRRTKFESESNKLTLSRFKDKGKTNSKQVKLKDNL